MPPILAFFRASGRATRSLSRRMLLVCAVLLGVLPGAAAGASDEVFLFAHFYTTGESGLHFAWSEDGYRFELLNGGASFLKPAIGEAKILRDPALMRGPDGVFRLVWTTGWTGKAIGYASSRDLIHWSEQREIPVMAEEPKTQNCWAPEVIWDPANQHYLIFWSSTVLGRFPETENSNRRPDRNHRIYSTTTTDFETFTPTRLHYNGGFNVIDATLAPDGGRWLMFVKNETFAPKTEKNIRLIRAQTPSGPFSEPSPPITGAYWAEGPSALQVGSTWFVYFDKHMENRYGLVVSDDLEHWRDVSDRVSFPKDARHGTVLRVPRAVLLPLLELSKSAPAGPRP